MRRLLYVLLFMYLSVFLPVNAIEYNGVYENNQVVYSPSLVFWSEGVVSKDSISLVKHMSEPNGVSSYKSECLDLKLNSDFEFLYMGRLIGVDNKNFKFYEVLYKNNSFFENLLTYEQVQEIFDKVDVIKISDFSKGTYNIINHGEEKQIILFNDTDENLENYSIKPEKISINSDIKPNILIPKRGKIVFSDVNDKTKNIYVIKVR